MFRTEALRQRIELIIHLIEFGRQLIVIQGAPGLGKTSLLNAIEESADSTWVFIRVTAARTSSRETLLEKVAANLDFEPTERFAEQEIIEEVRRRLQILDGNKQKGVLLIDDAEALPVECLALLLELAHTEDDSTELRVVIAADNSESSVLDQLHASARQNALIHTVDMPHMDRDQTASLISWWQDQELNAELDIRPGSFSTAAIDEIFAQSDGVPGDILILARQKWLSGQNVTLRADPVKKYIAVGAVALLLIGLFTFFGKDTKEPEVEELVIDLPDASQPPLQPILTESTADEPAAVNQVVPKEPGLEPKRLVNEDSEATRKTLAEQKPNESILEGTLQDIGESTDPPALVADDNLGDMLAATIATEVIADIPPETSLASDEASERDATVEPSPDTVAPAAAAQAQAKPAAPTQQRVEEASAKAQKTAPKVSIRLRSDATATKTSPESDPPVVKPPTPATPAKPAPDPAPPPSQTKPQKPQQPYTLAHLLRHSPDGYVLQLFGVRNHDAAAKYLKKHNLEANSAVVASMHDGEPWYVVIYGSYPTRDAASKAAKSLGKKLESLKPWPRPVASLK